MREQISVEAIIAAFDQTKLASNTAYVSPYVSFLYVRAYVRTYVCDAHVTMPPIGDCGGTSVIAVCDRVNLAPRDR